MKLKYLLLVALLALTACAKKPYVSQAQQEEKAIIDQYVGGLTYAKECLDKEDGNPDFILVYEQVTLKGGNPQNRTQLLASNKKLNSKQRAAFQNYLKITDACTRGVMSRLQGSPFYNLFQSTDSQLGINDANLLSDKINIGQANVRKLEIIQKFLADNTALQQQISARFSQAHGAELAAEENRRAAAAAAWASGMQGMANSYNNLSQYYLNQNQQLLQQNQYRAPTNTNCQPNGVGGFNCTSR